MFRKFLERKIRRQILQVSLATALLAFAGVFVLWNNQTFAAMVYPLRMFINNIHGGISALAIQMTGGAVDSFTLSPVGSYLIEFSGGSDAVIFPAGYLASALLGSIMFFLVNRAPQLARGLAVITGLFTVTFIALFIRPDESGDWTAIIICIGLGIVLALAGWKGRGDINQLKSRRSALQIVMNALSMMIALHVLLDLNYLLNSPASVESSLTGRIITNPAAAFAEEVMPSLSVAVVAIAWTAIAVAILGAAVYFSLIKSLRREVKDKGIWLETE